MANHALIRTIFGILGNISSICIFFSPVPAFMKIVRWRDTRGFSGFNYIMTCLNCSLWVLYGMPFVTPSSILVVTVNGIGVIFEIVYIVIFFIFLRNHSTRKKLLGLITGCVMFFTVVTVCCLLLIHRRSKRSFAIGKIAMILNICMYASPLAIMGKVITEKSVKYMPVTISIALSCNGCAWVVYGLSPLDLNILISNGIGAVLGFSQLMLYGCYHSSTRWDDEEEEENARKGTHGIEMASSDTEHGRPGGASTTARAL